MVFRPVNPNETLTTPDEWLDFKQAQHKFYQGMLTHMSTFNEDTISILHAYVRGGVFAWCDNQARIQSSESNMLVSSVDVNRLYPYTLMTSHVPVVSTFDAFEPITGYSAYADCNPHDLFI